jgi:hypothetical protein
MQRHSEFHIAIEKKGEEKARAVGVHKVCGRKEPEQDSEKSLSRPGT